MSGYNGEFFEITNYLQMRTIFKQLEDPLGTLNQRVGDQTKKKFGRQIRVRVYMRVGNCVRKHWRRCESEREERLKSVLRNKADGRNSMMSKIRFHQGLVAYLKFAFWVGRCALAFSEYSLKLFLVKVNFSEMGLQPLK